MLRIQALDWAGNSAGGTISVNVANGGGAGLVLSAADAAAPVPATASRDRDRLIGSIFVHGRPFRTGAR
jgi:hypothetical protein